MEVPCIACHRKNDLSEMKVIYVYVHEGDCTRWVQNREILSPSWTWTTLNSVIESAGVIKLCAVGLFIASMMTLFFD